MILEEFDILPCMSHKVSYKYKKKKEENIFKFTSLIKHPLTIDH